jgi:hypothetical protein
MLWRNAMITKVVTRPAPAGRTLSLPATSCSQTGTVAFTPYRELRRPYVRAPRN